MADILDYCKGMKTQSFEPGEVLIHEGLTLGKLFVLIEGQIEVIRRDTPVTHVDEPGSVFGEMSVLLDQPYSATVKALSGIKVYVIEDAYKFLESKPEVSIHIATLLARRLYYTTAYLVDLQQQMAGRRKDLDVVDKILGSLFQQPAEVKPAKSAKPRAKKT
jgi:CRP/FNR family transcriptional regulator, cyclic AMP receptor protein